MERKQRALLVVAAVAVVASVVLFLRQCRSDEGPPREPDALYVCDHCGREVVRPFDDRSPDCPACAEGQLVQRVFFRCNRCGKVFEAYQVNWSPDSPRAEAEVERADAEFKGKECSGTPKLVRRPGGLWVWAMCAGGGDAGSRIMNELRCPQCGRGAYGDFAKVLVPPRR